MSSKREGAGGAALLRKPAAGPIPRFYGDEIAVEVVRAIAAGMVFNLTSRPLSDLASITRGVTDWSRIGKFKACAADEIFVRQLCEQFGLEKPMIVQPWTFISGVAQFDLGFSYRWLMPAANVRQH